jgi:hypothetical protein
MKKLPVLFFMAALLFAFQPSEGQIRKIPAEVTDAFKVKYPDASAVEWKDKLAVFQAQFKLNDESYQARFNSAGEWQETEKAIEENDLPAPVSEGFSKSKFTEWEVREVSVIEKKDGAKQYRILVKKSDIEKKYLYFDKEGKLIRDSYTLNS